MPLPSSRQIRVLRKALSFDGVDDYVDVGDFWFSEPKFTIIVWFAHDNIIDHPYARIIAKADGFYLYGGIHLQQGITGAWFWNDGTNRDSIDAGSVQERVWYMKAIVFDYPDVSSYINDVQYSSKTTTVAPTGATGYSWFIGKRYGAVATEIMEGLISSILIYNRALSDSEIKHNYYYPDNPVKDGLVLWLHWDTIDTANGVWRDKSGYGNDGVIYGATEVDWLRSPVRVNTSVRELSPLR